MFFLIFLPHSNTKIDFFSKIYFSISKYLELSATLYNVSTRSFFQKSAWG